jgi:hypothetical protein
MRHTAVRSRSVTAIAAAALLALGLSLAAGCGGNGQAPAGGTAGSTSGTSSSSSGGSGGAGGSAPSMSVCISSPKPMPFPGTDDCPAPMPAQPDAFDAALTAGGIDRCHVRLLPSDVALSGWPSEVLADKHQLPDFAALQLGPLRLPGYARETKGWLDAAVQGKNPVSDTLAALSVRRGHAIANACVDLTPFVPQKGDTTPLATAVLLLDQHLGQPGDETALRAAAGPVPIELQNRLALVVGALDHAVSEVRAALGTTDIGQLFEISQAHALYLPSVSGFNPAAIPALDAVDLGRITEAAALLARVVEAQDFGSIPDAKFAPFEATTPVGAVVVHDSSPDTYVKGSNADRSLLLFDLGGDDVYQVGAGASDDKHPVSLAIDVRGKDKYGYVAVADPADAGLLPSDGSGRYHSSTTPDMDNGPITLSRVGRQGAGLAGIGMLFDLGPEGDSYQSLAVSQGFAAAGVGVLYDAGGDDTYAAEAGAQGSAIYGIGVLIDGGGNDTYASFTLSQGFGGAEGAGALVDAAGDDTYTVDIGDPMHGGHPLYYSPQLPGTGNSSMSQGAAQGRMPQSATDTAYMAGGLGVLRDVSGKDRYTGSVFAQGVGYWQGIGLFLEGGGDDVYQALWYIQGSTAHFALSMFLEEGGNDQYDLAIPPAATSIGVGHDFSASIHLDEGGDDQYQAPGLSLGSGNINGIGCFVNVGGNDTYTAAGDPTLGAGNYSSEAPFGDPRQAAPTIGIFVDAGGTDTYTVAGTSRALDGTTWSYDPQPYPAPDMVTTEHGCGADQDDGTVSLP